MANLMSLYIPICSMYGIFTNIYHIHEPNVGKYTIWLVVSTPLKNISRLGLLFPTFSEKYKMFQTTNQI